MNLDKEIREALKDNTCCNDHNDIDQATTQILKAVEREKQKAVVEEQIKLIDGWTSGRKADSTIATRSLLNHKAQLLKQLSEEK